MFNLGRVRELLNRALSGAGRKSIQLNDAAEQVLKQAESRGYRVARSNRQGVEAIVLERGSEGAVHLWSNEDIVAFGRSKNWL